MATIKEIRKKNNLTVRSFGDLMKMSYTYISNVENGHESISIKTLEKIAKEFKEPLDELLIAHGYLPDYTKEARQKDSKQVNKALKKVAKKIMEEE